MVVNSAADEPVLINGVDVVAQNALLNAQLANLTVTVAQLQTAFRDTGTAFRPALLVNGAGSDVVNGPYKREGMSGGRPVYVKVEADGGLYVSPNDAHIWIAFGTVHSLSTTHSNAITGSCGCAVSCQVYSPSIRGLGVHNCGVGNFVRTVSMTTSSMWTIGDSNGMAYFTSTNSSSGGRPPIEWSLGANGLDPAPWLTFR